MDEKLEKYFFEKTKPEFQQLCIVLHDVILAANPEIKASLKWQMPAYDYKGLMMGVGAFKHKVTIFFHRGAEMKDPQGWFKGQEENKTMRSIQLKSIDEIDGNNLEKYIREAIRVNKQGKPKKTAKREPKPLPPIPEELQILLDENPFANEFFQTLNKTQKREYIVWISSAKREETKNNRLNKTLEKLNKNLTCWSKYNS